MFQTEGIAAKVGEQEVYDERQAHNDLLRAKIAVVRQLTPTQIELEGIANLR